MVLPRSLINLTDTLAGLVQGRLWLQVIIAMILGVVFGIIIGPSAQIVSIQTSELIAGWAALPGRLFLIGIQFIIIPLIVASVIRGIAAGEELEDIGKLGIYTISFFLITTIIAVAIGLIAAILIQPGKYIDSTVLANIIPDISENVTSSDSSVTTGLPTMVEMPDILIGLFPRDPLATFVSGNMLQTVISAIIIGIALLALPISQRKPILDLLGSIQAVCMVIVAWVLKFVPLAVFGLIANISARVGVATLYATAIYVLTVIAALIVLILVYLIIVWVFTSLNPLSFFRISKESMLLALSTSSSAAVMPVTMKTVEEDLAIRPGISRFVIPLGTTINMAGTALYQGTATLFLAQVFQVDICLSGMILVTIMATGASIGSPGTPGVGIVILATILESVGIPASGIALIMGVDRILDMCRTSVNVLGDISASTVLNNIIKQDSNK